ncbi:MAG: glutamate synthase central domain-containing protein [Nitrososphaerota archaeon]
MSIWRRDIVSNLRALAGVEGKTAGEPPIASMGTTNPPLIEKPQFILDHIVSDGAQVTRPSIDPYREPTETEVYLFDGEVRLLMPLIIGGLCGINPQHILVVIQACFRMGVGVHLEQPPPPTLHPDVRSMILLDAQLSMPFSIDRGPLVYHVESVEDLAKIKDILEGIGGRRKLVARIPCISSQQLYSEIVGRGFQAVIIDEELGGDEPLEVALSQADHTLKRLTINNHPARYLMSLIAASRRIRSSSDIFKLGGLGADACVISDAWRIGVDYRSEMEPSLLSERIENLLIGMQREIKLLMGAAGVSSFQSSIVGSRELFRAIDLPQNMCMRLGVKPAGE